jgi:hypothetical protein
MDEPHASLQLANEPYTRREKVFCAPQTVTSSNVSFRPACMTSPGEN